MKPIGFSLSVSKLLPLLCLLILLISLPVHGQNLQAAARRSPHTMDLFNGMPNAREPAKVQGDIYFNKYWRLTSFTLYENNQVVEGYYSRYNLHFDELEFRTANGIKAIANYMIKDFSFKDTIPMSFINAKDYNLNDVPLRGFFEVLAEGKMPLLKHHFLLVKEPDYHPALSAGSRDTKIIKQSELFYANGKEVFKVKKNKKILKVFGDKQAEVEKYMKENSIRANDQKGLIKIFQYYNSL